MSEHLLHLNPEAASGVDSEFSNRTAAQRICTLPPRCLLLYSLFLIGISGENSIS
jgi:hypothetical protein